MITFNFFTTTQGNKPRGEGSLCSYVILTFKITSSGRQDSTPVKKLHPRRILQHSSAAPAQRCC
jgi:hypothetical protein